MVALGLAFGLVVAGTVTETVLPAGLWLAVLAVLDVVAIVLLRQALHVGLLEEASERPLGPEITCANCGARTVSHTFCGHCGIALAALPHAAFGQAEGPARGRTRGRLSEGAEAGGPRRVLAGAGLIGVAAAAGLAVAALEAPVPRAPVCRPGLPCGGPPVAHLAVGTPFAGYTGWQSRALGFSLRFETAHWQIAGAGPTTLRLRGPSGPSAVYLQGFAASGASPAALIARAVAGLQGQLLGLAPDTARADQVLGPGVGLMPGAGAVYRATTATPQGPGDPVAVALLAAQAEGRALVVTVITPAADATTTADVLDRADDTINSIRFAP